MSCCCTKIYRLCDQVVCDDEDLVLPIPVPTDGQYTCRLNFLGDVLERIALLSADDNATFDKGELNESFTYVGQVLKPDGTVLSFTIDEVVYDCFEFTTKRALTWTPSVSTSSSS